MRLSPFARPTARAAPGRPSPAASSAYVVVAPHGTRLSSRQTASWNGVPGARKGIENVRSSRAK